jgi:deazaflavin-dependent oxidoreductase (nitroreductase family)
MSPVRAGIGNAAGTLLRTRWVVRAPIALYRARLGFVFGRRLLMLEHRGRRTGARRYVVLEVIDHPAPGQYVVASGFGFRAQWLRNVQHDPRVKVTIGSHRPRDATATLLDRRQGGEALRRYAEQHPRAWEQLKPIFEQLLGSAITETETALPLVKLSMKARE